MSVQKNIFDDTMYRVQVPGSGIKPGTLHLSAQNSTIRPLKAFFPCKFLIYISPLTCKTHPSTKFF